MNLQDYDKIYVNQVAQAFETLEVDYANEYLKSVARAFDMNAYDYAKLYCTVKVILDEGCFELSESIKRILDANKYSIAKFYEQVVLPELGNVPVPVYGEFSRGCAQAVLSPIRQPNKLWLVDSYIIVRDTHRAVSVAAALPFLFQDYDYCHISPIEERFNLIDRELEANSSSELPEPAASYLFQGSGDWFLCGGNYIHAEGCKFVPYQTIITGVCTVHRQTTGSERKSVVTHADYDIVTVEPTFYLCVDSLTHPHNSLIQGSVNILELVDVYQKYYKKFVGIDFETNGLNNVVTLPDGTRECGADVNLVFQVGVLCCDNKLEVEHTGEFTVYHPYMRKLFQDYVAEMHKDLLTKLDRIYYNTLTLDENKGCEISTTMLCIETLDGSSKAYMVKNAIPELTPYLLKEISAVLIQAFILRTISKVKYNHRFKLGTTVFGNTVSFDMDFIKYQMPILSEHINHRSIDVSALAIVLTQIGNLPPLKKEYAHTGLSDIKETHRELMYYLDSTGVLIDYIFEGCK